MAIDQKSEQIGKLAAEAFLNRVKKSAKKVSLNKILVDAELVVRDSSMKIENGL